jgi:hypothetical protein
MLKEDFHMRLNESNYKLTDADKALIERVQTAMKGDIPEGGVPNLREFLASPSAQVLIPKVILGKARLAQEMNPASLVSPFLKKIRMTNAGSMVIFPSFGPIRAYDVSEGAEIPEDTFDNQMHEGGNEIRVGKVGVRVRVTDELVQDSQWDIISMLVESAGRALVRHKEQKIYTQFEKHGHTLFDNLLGDPDAHTHGLGDDGNANDTLAPEDLLDLIIAMHNNDMIPTDVVMHPLVWGVLLKSDVATQLAVNPIGMTAMGSLGPKTVPALGPESIQGRIPYGLNIVLSPFAPLDRETRRYSMYAMDRNNIGVILQKQDLTTEEFDEPSRDIRNIKMIERYGIGILNEGRAIVVAKNLKLDTTHPKPVVVRTLAV